MTNGLLYPFDYIISQQSTDWTMRVISILALLLVCLVFSVLYMRDRMRTRWRDLGVGALILSLVLVGDSDRAISRLE